MHKISLKAAAALAAIAVTSCSGGQSSFQPNVTTVVNPITQSTLQFAVGTANIAGTVGLNTVMTLRQNSGSSIGTSVLTNSPTIVGPSGFTVPSVIDAYGDAGTNSMTGTLETNLTQIPKASTFDPDLTDPNTGGPGIAYNALASSLGFIPATVPQASDLPNLFPYVMPFFPTANPALTAAANPSLCVASQETSFNAATPAMPDTQLCYVGGPPAFVPSGHTSTQDGSFPKNYPGFGMGFTDFQAAPVAGTYTVNVTIPTGINSSSGQSSFGVKTATASLATLTALPAWTTPPTFASDGNGGGTVTTNFGGGGGITEEYVEVVDEGPATCQATGAAPYFYTFKVNPGTATVTVPDNLGAAGPGAAQGPTFCKAVAASGSSPAIAADTVLVYGVATDYPLIESAFPSSSGNAAPAIAGAGGQADLTSSIASTGTE